MNFQKGSISFPGLVVLHAAPELQLIQIIDCCSIKISWSDGLEIHLLTDMYADAMMEKVLLTSVPISDFNRF